jgi:DNA polymerase V
MDTQLNAFTPHLPLSALALRWIKSPCPQAGFRSPAADYIETTLDLHEYLILNPVATFYLRVQGDSMMDAHIHDGDILVVDRSRTPRRGAIVVASCGGGQELLVKEYSGGGGRPVLLSRNAARAADYPRIEVNEDVGDEIWGVVVATVRKF